MYVFCFMTNEKKTGKKERKRERLQHELFMHRQYKFAIHDHRTYAHVTHTHTCHATPLTVLLLPSEINNDYYGLWTCNHNKRICYQTNKKQVLLLAPFFPHPSLVFPACTVLYPFTSSE